MVTPYVPTPLATPILNPSIASVDAPAFPYISVSQYTFAPTAMAVNSLVKGGTDAQNTQALADTIGRASSWANLICFGSDASGSQASLAASLSVQAGYMPVRGGEVRLVCNYKPVIEVIGIDTGASPALLASIGPSAASMVRIGSRTIYVPAMSGFLTSRPGDSAAFGVGTNSSVYAVWSYINGYPHTQLAEAIAAGTTSCTVKATNGAGGLFGVYPGTQMTIADGGNTETITVTGITANGTTTILTTTPFLYNHLVPAPPDFLPVSALPAGVVQAVISLTTCLIKTRGARAMVLPTLPGGAPTRQAFAEAGALEDWDIALKILTPYRIHLKGNR